MTRIVTAAAQFAAAVVLAEGTETVWQSIAAAPSDLDVEVAVIDREGSHPLVVPCRRASDGWIDAASKRRLDIRPTHWRPWSLKRR